MAVFRPPARRKNETDEAYAARHQLAKRAHAQREADRIAAREEKAQARAHQKELERQEKIRAAAGATIRLPALVDRRTLATVPSTLTAVAQLLAACIRADELTVDCEASGYPLGHNLFRLKTVQLGNLRQTAVLDPHDADQADLVRLALAKARVLYAYSATADVCPLVAGGFCGEDIWEIVQDVAILVRIAGMGVRMQAGLKDTAKELLPNAVAPAANDARAALFKAAGWLTDTKVTTPYERNGWAMVDPECATMVRYAASDVLDTAGIAQRVPPLPPAVVEREHWLQRVTARLTQRGVKLHEHHTTWLHEEVSDRVADYTRQLLEHVEKPTSPAQIGLWLHGLGLDLPTNSQGYSSDKNEIQAALRLLDPDHPARAAAQLVLDFRVQDTRLKTFLTPYVDMLHNGDGRVRPTIYTLGADTGRMSSARPNLQNVPRQGGLRSCFEADPGMLGISADLAGIEMRVMAAMSQDPVLLEMIRDAKRAEELLLVATTDAQRAEALELKKHADIHWRIAREVWGPEATKEDRYSVKPVVYAHFYGGGIDTISKQTGIHPHTVAMVVESIAALCAGLRAWSDDMIQQVRNGLTEFQLYNGRTLYLDQDVPYKGPNWIIQGSAREIIVDGMERWERTRWGGGVVLPIHDEIVTFVPADQAEEAVATLRECLCGEFQGVEISAEASPPWQQWPDAS